MLPPENLKKWRDLVQSWHPKVCFYQPKINTFNDNKTIVIFLSYINLDEPDSMKTNTSIIYKGVWGAIPQEADEKNKKKIKKWRLFLFYYIFLGGFFAALPKTPKL